MADGPGRFWAAMGAGAAAASALWMINRQRRRISLRRRVVVITGGSRGLGLHMARKFAAEGARIALIARDIEELRRAQADLHERGAEVVIINADVTNRSHVEEAVAQIGAHFHRIDVLVNNAGVIQVGPMEHMAVEDYEFSVAIHVMAPLYTTLAALPWMHQVGGGRIVNISSIGGKVGMPHLLPYCVGKFGLVGLSDAMRAELRRHNIYVTTVCPSLMRTGSPTQALFKGQHDREYAWFMTGDVMPLVSISASRAAEEIVQACKRGDARLLVGWPAKVAVLLNELAPEMVANLSDRVNRLLPGPMPDHSHRSWRGWESRAAAPRWAERRRDEVGSMANETPQ